MTLSTVLVVTGLALLAWLLDYLAAALGAKRFGSSSAGLWGSIVGFIVGALGSAVTAELFVGRPLPEAVQAGIGAFVGTLGGILAKIIVLLSIAFVVYPRFFQGAGWGA